MDNDSYQDRQDNERAALKAIYGEQMREIETESEWSPLECILTLSSQGIIGNQPKIPTVDLHIVCPLDYPNITGIITLALAHISANVVFLSNTITKLEEKNIPLTENLKTVNKAIDRLENIGGKNGEVIKEKVRDVLKKNPGYEIIQSIGAILLGTNDDTAAQVMQNTEHWPVEPMHHKRKIAENYGISAFP